MQVGLVVAGVAFLVTFFVLIRFAMPKDGVTKRVATGKTGDVFAYFLTVLMISGVSCLIAGATQWSGPGLQG